MTFEFDNFSAHSALPQPSLSSGNIRNQPTFRTSSAGRASLFELAVGIAIQERHPPNSQPRFRWKWFRLFGSNLGVGSPDECSEPVHELASRSPSPLPDHVRLRPHSSQHVKLPSVDTKPIESIVVPRNRRVSSTNFPSLDVEALR